MDQNELKKKFDEVIAKMPITPSFLELAAMTGVGSHTMRKFCGDEIRLPWIMKMKILRWINQQEEKASLTKEE